MVNASSPGRAALEENEKGCSRSAKGELRKVSQANWPGWNVMPACPSGRSVSVQASPRSFLTSSTT
jgi:hypothetical protein